jgi:hypothetical protein
MFETQRWFGIVLLADVFPKFTSDFNVLDTVLKHFFGILGEVFEFNLVIRQSVTPRLE